MGKRILISFLGTGIFSDKSKRVYSPVNYHLDDQDLGNYSFVGVALKDHYKIDNVVLIGSVHSMWEEIYKIFTPPQDFDPNIHVEIGMFCDEANSKSPLEFPYRDLVEQNLGPESKIVLIKYGSEEKEIRENIKIILGIEQYFNSGDELIVDITHSFRSLPIYIMQLLIFLRNVKNITISHIFYGMFEMRNELGYAPIVDLTSILDVNDWITGAYNFKEFGNTYKIAKLLESDPSGHYSNSAKLLRRFADAKNLNQLREFRTGIKELAPLIDNQNLPDIGKLLIPDIIGKFAKRFPETLNEYIYQFRMAEWHERHHNYGYALINLVESALSFCCELVPDSSVPDELITNKKGIIQRNKRGEILPKTKRKAIRRALNYVKEDQGVESIEGLRNELESLMRFEKITFGVFNSYYDRVNTNRNTIAHDLDRESPKSYSDIIKDLKDGLKYYREIFNRLP